MKIERMPQLAEIHRSHQCQHVAVTLEGKVTFQPLHIYNVQLKRFKSFQRQATPEMRNDALRWFLHRVLSIVSCELPLGSRRCLVRWWRTS